MASIDLQNISGVRLVKRDGVELIEIENHFASAVITTFGGSVLSYTPKHQQDLLWVSDRAVYDGTKPVRGGIPVCWPWFGKAVEEGLPAHGFVRNMVWDIEAIEQLENGVVSVCLSCSSDSETEQLWPHQFKLSLCIQIGVFLTLNLTTHNLNDHEIQITEALHTYFNIADPRGLVIQGLEGSVHLDKLVDDAEPEIQRETVVLHPAKDSVYLDHTGKAMIEDQGHQRRIIVKKRNSQSSVVWNPGAEIVKGFADIDDQAWLEFVCVESGNVLDDVITIPAHSEHTLSVQYSMVTR